MPSSCRALRLLSPATLAAPKHGRVKQTVSLALQPEVRESRGQMTAVISLERCSSRGQLGHRSAARERTAVT